MAALLMSLVLTVPFQTQVYAQGSQNIETEETETAEEGTEAEETGQGLQNIETEETETAEEGTEAEETETAEADTVSESTPAANSVYQDIVYDVIGHGAAGMGVYIEEYMGSAADLAIPSEIDGYEVMSIAYGAFQDCTSLETVTLPGTISSIGNRAFMGCTNLKSINIPSGVSELGEEAFRDCTSLVSVDMPSVISSAGLENRVFQNCSSLEEITLPTNLVSIGEWTFGGCESLTFVEIPNRVTSIGMRAFSGCSSLKEVVLPGSVTAIGTRAFTSCDSLTDLSYSGTPEQWTQIAIDGELGNGMTQPSWYYEESGRNQVSIVKYGGSAAEVVIPDRIAGDLVIGVNEGAFDGCSQVTSIQIPAGMTTIETSAFSGCTALQNFSAAEGNETYLTTDGVLYTADGTTLRCYPTGRKGAFTVPDTVRTISYNAFQNASGLTSITIPGSVQMVQANAFDNCTGLQTVIYNGSERMWERITIDENGNSALTEADRQMQDAETFTVRFDAFGVAEYDDLTVEEYGFATRPANDPEREGYEFLGWYNGDEEWNFSGDEVTSDVTLTAKWMADEPAYTILGVTYDSNNMRTGYRIVPSYSSFQLSVGRALATYPDSVVSINWSSSSPNVVNNTTNGDWEANIQTLAPGVGNITCSVRSILTGVQYDDRTDTETFHIRVVNPATTVSLGESTKQMRAGDTDILEITTSPGNNWARVAGGFQLVSSDPAVVSVTTDGCLTALKAGTAQITASLDNGAQALCTVTVTGSTSGGQTGDTGENAGDIDGSGSITILDVMMCRDHVTGRRPLEGAALETADLNQDGNVNILDVMMINRMVTGNPEE